MLKNLKSLFIVDDSEEKDNNASKSDKNPDRNSADKGAAAKKPQSSPQKNPGASSSEGTLDTKIIEKLLQAIEKSNLEGFDYLEYKKSLKALEKMPMDEATKYRSAFATASTMGVTLDKLLQTVRFYIGVLDKENEQFLSAFKNQFTSKVANKEKEIVQFESIIKEKSQKIKQLTEEITKHQKQITDLKVKMEESNNKIGKTQNDFKLSYKHLKSQFEEDIVKMQKYLK